MACVGADGSTAAFGSGSLFGAPAGLTTAATGNGQQYSKRALALLAACTQHHVRSNLAHSQ
eukprot:1846148-Amphidinium_carterae.1